MFGYRVPAPDEAMLISGGRRGLKGAPFRVVTGHGKFVLPIFRKTRFLTLAMREAEVAETCVTRQGIVLTVRAVIAFKVGNDTESIVNAGQRFLSEQEQMSVLTGRIFSGHLRSIIGSMTVEEIVTERQKLATEVLETSKTEMGKIGLIVDSLQIQSIDDGDTGYIEAMSAPHKAAIQRQAKIAEAKATQASVEAQQEAERNQAEYNRQTAVVQAEYKAEVDRAQAQSAQAGPLAQAHAQQEVLAAQTELAERAARLRQQELVAEVVKPAEAEAERIRVVALADAERMKIQAEAAASHDRVALDQLLINQLPEIVKEAAAGLSHANVNVLNGADGLGEIAAGLVGQGLTILDTVKQNLGTPGAEKGAERATTTKPRTPQQRSGPDDGPVAIP
ncbi:MULTISPECIES: SPFH domain-containing protein [unclassified Streptomyces]|uniref:flotillin family protein n=1 Tax=unclassified Streptomyces TaxID=2593676 RepID=UPI002DDBC5A0|nr:MULTISPECIES: SPFH domain-containing protein [unclassified Streptomyces]WSA92948.1 SPFH domain-containing protein [Streptomyces sp. NBC_01795]WSB77317.1 SPFH domain-containing protein [Streptomyces sp. NBC_01775]WSS14418.1 SPFH domain-containing protein [Streptomyces sp. NBC_01186]WSS43235.1 SPFH domain-containing protein [Streptomyces sp. NBC_01187]